MAVYPASSWVNEWNDIIRYIIFPDVKLKELMLIPTGSNIIDFRDRYFVRAGYTSTILKDEKIRIVYGMVPAYETDAQRILENEISFDIYVKQDQVNNAGDDRLMYRTELIAERLNQLLNVHTRLKVTDKNNVTRELAYKFRCIGMSDLGTPTVGYVRYNITFKYMRTV